MIIKPFLLFLFVCSFGLGCEQPEQANSTDAQFMSVSKKQPQHVSTYDALLKKHVSSTGQVNYAGFKKDEAQLDKYLTYLSETSPANSWSADKKKAFWINAYNAYTIKLILDNPQVKSIKSINESGDGPWKKEFAKVGGNMYTLDHIEHTILRPTFNDPRIHVGVNCASISCPKLANYAFTEANINGRLESLMRTFINDDSRNKIARNKVEISEIFNWFKDDFTNNGSVIDYLNRYADVEINQDASISYLNYNWQLND